MQGNALENVVCQSGGHIARLQCVNPIAYTVHPKIMNTVRVLLNFDAFADQSFTNIHQDYFCRTAIFM